MNFKSISFALWLSSLVWMSEYASGTEIIEGDIQGWSNSYRLPKKADDCNSNLQKELNCTRDDEKRSLEFIKDAQKKVFEETQPAARESFRVLQKRWGTFRDASCSFEALTTRQSWNAELVESACRVTYNLERAELLSKYAYCLSGGRCSSDFSLQLISTWMRTHVVNP